MGGPGSGGARPKAGKLAKLVEGQQTIFGSLAHAKEARDRKRKTVLTVEESRSNKQRIAREASAKEERQNAERQANIEHQKRQKDLQEESLQKLRECKTMPTTQMRENDESDKIDGDNANTRMRKKTMRECDNGDNDNARMQQKRWRQRQWENATTATTPIMSECDNGNNSVPYPTEMRN